jgi:hypothetical protein
MAEATAMKELDPAAREVIKQANLGPGMKRLTMQRESAYMDLKNSGRLKACTVVNLNPLSLKVEDTHVPSRVPAGNDPLGKRIIIEHGGRKFQASFLTIREPSFVAWIRDVHKPADEGENASAEYDPKWVLPLEAVDQYRIQYTQPQFTPMGGVLAFEGDIHALKEALKDEGTIRIPTSSRLQDGTRSYFSKEVSVMKELAATLEMQKTFCMFMIQQGDEYDQDAEQRKNITPVHRLWLTFAMEMGWKQVAPPWMNATLDSEEACKGCGKGRTRQDAFFCSCGRPFNAYAAYMAGENVPESYLFALKGKEFDDVMKELAKRKKMMARFAAADEPAEKPAKATAAADKPADEPKAPEQK